MLSAGQQDSTVCLRLFDEVILDLAKANWFVNMTVTDTHEVIPAAVQSFPANAVNLLGVFYGAHQVEMASLRELEYAAGPQWRDDVGEPVSYVVEGETVQTFRLYPQPNVKPSALGALFGEPLGRDFLDGAIVVLHSETRETVPDYLDLPIALMVIGREFERESDHQHTVFARSAGRLGTLILKMVTPRAD